MASAADVVQTGFQHHQAGDLVRAEQCYRQVLGVEPDNADAWALLGAVDIGLERMDQAVEHLRYALRLNPNHGPAHDNLGIALARLDRLDEAAACFQDALRLNPMHADTYMNLGNVQSMQGKLREAEASYCRAVALNPDSALTHFNLGNTLNDQNKRDEAVACYRQALRLNPADPRVYNNLGTALQELGKTDEAVASFREAIRLKPDYGRAHSNLGNAFREQGKLEEAVACCQQALRLEPDCAEAYNTLGATLVNQGKVDEALTRFQPALQLKPGYANAYHNLGAALLELGRTQEALQNFEEAVRLKPDYATARMSLGMVHLLLGNFERAWPDYEWRWRTKEFPPRSFTQPRWDGKPLGGQTILLHAEQGLGDTLQFIRYAPLVKQRGGRVIVEVQPPLARIVAGCLGVDNVVAAGSPLPHFDVYAPLLSLPSIFKTTPATVPTDVPYVFADRALEEHWQKELGGIAGYKVGLNWQGNPQHKKDRQRSFPLALLAPLAQAPGVQLISIQQGPGVEQLTDVDARVAVVDPSRQTPQGADPFQITAAIMKNLDLVISSDTATAHLAGALGVPVWVALPFAPDWRWMLEREDSPWYPTMRLFRQQRPGDWQGVFDLMAGALGQHRTPGRPIRTITVEVAPGELIDKITILEIKRERMSDEKKVRNVRRELEVLEDARAHAVPGSAELTRLTADLKAANKALWDIEDAIRHCERAQDFGPRFIELARSVYRTNDRRAALKREINELLGARFLEEKSYEKYE
jgi:tetratricopeptide (TPR) repeat protein